MLLRFVCYTVTLALAVVLAVPATAYADAIDGDWCNGAASLQIRGPSIRTPAGTDMTGDYSRHAFRYVAPAGEKDAGAEVLMRLMNENTVYLMRRAAGAESAVETWQRCQPVS